MYSAELLARFWAKVDRRGPDECWEWTGSKGPRTSKIRADYGLFRVRPKTVRAHRFSYELTNGPVPADLWVLHRCDNPPCCNPRHLFLGTHRDNIADMMLKGRNVLPPATNGFEKRRPAGESNTKAKLTAEIVRRIRATYATGQHSQQTIAELHGLRQTQVSRIIRREHWKHIA